MTQVTLTAAQQLLADNMTISDKGAVTIDKDVFQAAVGLTKEEEEKVVKAHRQIANDVGVAMSHKSVEVFKSNAELKSVSFSQRTLGNSVVTAKLAKERQFPNPQEPGKQVTAHGVLTIGVTTGGKATSDAKAFASKLFEAEFGAK